MQKYAQDVLSITQDNNTKVTLISLLNFATSAQKDFNCNLDKLANSILDSLDKNIDKFSSKGKKLFDSVNEAEKIKNIDDYITTNNLAVSKGVSLGYTNTLKIAILLKSSTALSDEENNRYNVVGFTQSAYNKIIDNYNDYSLLNSESNYVREFKRILINKSYMSFETDIPSFGLNDTLYLTSYYKKNNNLYFYELYQLSFLSALKSAYITYLNSNSTNYINLIISGFNFIAELNQEG